MSKTKADRIIERFDNLRTSRVNFENTWQEISKYCLSRKAYINRVRNPGEKLDSDIYDSTAMWAAQVLAAGLHSYLTNPTARWFGLRMQNPSHEQDKDVKQWLYDASNTIFSVLNGSNFSQMIHEGYLDLGVFGTTGIYEEEDPEDIVRFYCRPIEELFIEEDERERVSGVFRKYKMTVKQAYLKWGNKCSEEIITKFEKMDYHVEYEFIHLVEPRYSFDPRKKNNKNFPIGSYHVDVKAKRLISESGYQEMPWFVPRFYKEAGTPYGSSPGFISLADIKMLNKMSYIILRAAQKVVDPPILLPHDGFLLPFKTGPNAINYRLRGTPQDKVEPVSTGANIPVGLEMEDRRRDGIKKNFFVDMFLMLAENTGDMTATEVVQRNEEKMLILGPALGRMMSELLDPIINRTFNILLRNGMIQPPPASIANQNYVIEYTSPLARAQKTDEMKAINSAMAVIGNVGAVIPSVLDKIDGDKFVDKVGDLYGVAPVLIRDDKEVKAIRDSRAKAQEEANRLALTLQGAQVAKTGAEAVRTLKGGKE